MVGRAIRLTSDPLWCVSWDPSPVVDVIRGKVQRTHDDSVLVLAEVEGFPRLDARGKGRQQEVKGVKLKPGGSGVTGGVTENGAQETCSPWCSGEQESSRAVGSGRRRTGLPLCFLDSSSR